MPLFYHETRLDKVRHVHRHLLDLSGVELLDITEVPHVALCVAGRERRGGGGVNGWRWGGWWWRGTLTKDQREDGEDGAAAAVGASLVF